MKSEASDRKRAGKVATVATLIGMSSYVLIALIFNLTLIDHLTAQVDVRVEQHLTAAFRSGGRSDDSLVGPTTKDTGDLDDDDAPVFVWKVASHDVTTALTSGAPRLPSSNWASGISTLQIGHSAFEFRARPFESGWLVAGESLSDVDRVRESLTNAELIFGGVLLFLMYGASFVVGIRALSPIARAQRRQREFTADASHELRTPLSVIDAEVSIALSKERDAQSYRSTLTRIGDESLRLQRIVEDLLWLARADGARTPHTNEIVDLADIVAKCSDRFDAVAQSAHQRLLFMKLGEEGALVRAPRDSIDRLAGVLIDNACKFAGPGGQVEVIVATLGNSVTLEIDDSGPGIDPQERELIFDRFHRTSTPAGGTGLGLAIADSIIRATQAHCTIGTSSLGGAKFEVTWRLVATKPGDPVSSDNSDA